MDVAFISGLIDWPLVLVTAYLIFRAVGPKDRRWSRGQRICVGVAGMGMVIFIALPLVHLSEGVGVFAQRMAYAMLLPAVVMVWRGERAKAAARWDGRMRRRTDREKSDANARSA